MIFEFISPFDKDKYLGDIEFEPTQIGSLAFFFEGKNIELSDFDIAIIGVPDERGSSNNQGTARAADIVRQHFYKLHIPFADREIRVLDLGNVVPGNDIRDTQFAIASILLNLHTRRIIPVIIGGGHNLTFGQYLGYQELYKLVNLVVVDEKIDLKETEENSKDSNSFLAGILGHNPNYLFNLSMIGYQTYLNNPFAIEMLDSLNYDCIRLGIARQKMEDLEPIIRDADLMSIDISSVRMADAPAHAEASPNGFSGEELCQLARYAGLSDKISSLGIYETNPVFDQRNQTVQLAAQLIWCFVEGFYNRKGDHPKNAENFQKFTVKLDEMDHEIVFWKSKSSDRWWMELPFGDREKFERHQMIPCNYSDYEMACKEEIPDRWMKVYNKLMEG
jgi:arginase family enzyme